MAFLKLEIITKIERNRAITNIKDAINSSQGWIVDHKLFSNNSASLTFEIPAKSIDAFLHKLNDAGFKPEIIGDKPLGSVGDIRCGLAITFIHNDPDMKREVPPFG